MRKTVYIITSGERYGVIPERPHIFVDEIELISINDDDEARVRYRVRSGQTVETIFEKGEYFLTELEAYETLLETLKADIVVTEYRIKCLKEGKPYYWQPEQKEG